MSKMEQFSRSSPRYSGNAPYLEALYEAYLQDPTSVPQQWQRYFTEIGAEHDFGLSHLKMKKTVLNNVSHRRPIVVETSSNADVRGLELVEHFRRDGHLYADLDPLKIPHHRGTMPALADFNLQEHDRISSSISGLKSDVSAVELYKHLKSIYSTSIGFEFMHIRNLEMRDWLQQYIKSYLDWKPSPSLVRKSLYQLLSAESMELMMGRKYVGQTRFSLEGGESLIPLVEHMILTSSERYNVEEVIIGMAHRGRLNVMLNVMAMSFNELCDLYTGKREDIHTSSDVTYHMGYSADRAYGGQKVHLSLSYNPSHLEFIGPVMMGSVRGRQEVYYPQCPEKILPIVMHGDSAIAGQGIVAEWFNMMNTPANHVKGAVHIVVNNGIGYTTMGEASRSGVYATDAHIYANVPVLHVNADDVDAVLFCAELAANFRARFKKSIIIDLNCYRRYGHNEADDPGFTQPCMYSVIKKHPTTATIYKQKCLDVYGMDVADVERDHLGIKEKLSAGERLIEITDAQNIVKTRAEIWQHYEAHLNGKQVKTSVPKKTLQALVAVLTDLPDGFSLHKQVSKLHQEYTLAVKGKADVRWGLAENLAYASLLQEGYGIRLVGQDVERGTFGHRHAVLHDQKNGYQCTPLHQLAMNARKFSVYNSVLSEQAVLGFEYGYASADPKTLVIWEAQFGDFCNGGQIIIDQFISSGWQKWKRLSGLVLLLPHGYEGKGPEHSSSRLERFLQLSAQHNMRVCVPSSAAQIFHLLRLQARQKARVPLICLTPKSLLRLPNAMSPLEDLYQGKFHEILLSNESVTKSKVKRVILCSGKIYYELLSYCQEKGFQNVVIARIEQLYPFPEDQCTTMLKGFKNLAKVVWCQEEPKNQGAWYFIRHHIEACIKDSVEFTSCCRLRSASPAAGYYSLHKQRQAQLIEAAFK